MIERDPLQLHALVEARQTDLRRDWRAAQVGPGLVRQAIGSQLIRWGEVLAGKHADLQGHHPATTPTVESALASR